FFVLHVLTTCDPFPSLDGFANPRDSGSGATSALVDAGGTEVEAGETEVDASDEARTACRSGDTILPHAALDAAPPGLAGPTSCGSEDALASDDRVARIDRNETTWGTIDGKNVTGCLGVEFDAPLKSVIVRAQSVQNACDASPCRTDLALCNTGHTMS